MDLNNERYIDVRGKKLIHHRRNGLLICRDNIYVYFSTSQKRKKNRKQAQENSQSPIDNFLQELIDCQIDNLSPFQYDANPIYSESSLGAA